MIAAQQIKALRLQHSYTQNYLASELKVSQKTYSNMECGKSKITVKHLIKLSKLYEISLVGFIELINQIDAKTINAIKKENPKITSSELLDGMSLQKELLSQYKGRIDDLKLLLEFKNNDIKLLKTQIEGLLKQTT